MAMQSINGYPCYDCADVALARRNIDPATKVPAATAAVSDPIVAEFNKPLASGPRGTLVNMLV